MAPALGSPSSSTDGSGGALVVDTLVIYTVCTPFPLDIKRDKAS
jgi:hypothetical protein